jgi:hypothetical protein
VARDYDRELVMMVTGVESVPVIG